MCNKMVIQLVFETKSYMNYSFVYKLLQRLDLLGDGIIRFCDFDYDPYSLKYKGNEIDDKISRVNYKVRALRLITSNKDINFQVSNPRVIGFSEIVIECQKSDRNVDSYINILLELFHNDFYMIHVLDKDEYYKQREMLEKLTRLKKRKYKILTMIYPQYIYRNIGINIGLSQIMYFGKHMFQYFDKEMLIDCPHVYEMKDINGMIKIQIYQNLDTKRKKSLERKIRKHLKIDEVANQMLENVYLDDNYGKYFMKGFEQYHPSYFYWDYDENDHKQDNKYVIPLTDHDIVLRKYKNSYFEKVDEDFAAGEIIGFFMYRPLGEALALKKVEDLEAFIFVELFDISSCMEDYAKKHGYQMVQIDEHKYLFEKEDEKIIDRFYYFMPENENHYKISLTIRKTLLNESTVKKVKSEYEKMIKSARLKRKE